MDKYVLGRHPMLLGFDQIERLIEQASKLGKDSYPPYNIVHSAPDRFRIMLAVAGFDRSELSITLEARELFIRGTHKDKPEGDVTYLHRGIATRQFVRSFILAEGVEVKDAFLENGVLYIDLSRQIPEKIIRKIEIKTA